MSSARARVASSGAACWRTVCLISMGLFLGLSLAVAVTGVLPGDTFVRGELTVNDTSGAVGLIRWVNHGGRAQVILPATILLFLLSSVARRYWWLWCVALVGAPLLQNVVKLLVGRSRPDDVSLGFPSGHATAAATYSVVLIYVAGRARLSRWQRPAVVALAVCFMFAVGLARIVRHAHWPSDVFGGFLLGIGCAAAAAWWEASHPEAGAPAAETR